MYVYILPNNACFVFLKYSKCGVNPTLFIKEKNRIVPSNALIGNISLRIYHFFFNIILPPFIFFSLRLYSGQRCSLVFKHSCYFVLL